MSEQLYRKVMHGKRTAYEPVGDAEPVTTITFTESEALTAAGALGTMLLMVFERNIPPHKRIARKIKAVEEAVLDLYNRTGAVIHEDIAELMARTWDRVMKEISAEKTGAAL